MSVSTDSKEVLNQFFATVDGKHSLLKTQMEGFKVSPPLLYDAWDIAELYIDKTYPNWHDYQMGWPQKFFIDRNGIVKSYTLGYSSTLEVGWDSDSSEILKKASDQEAIHQFLTQKILSIVN